MSDHPAIVADALRVHGTLYPDEQEQLLTRWAKLDQRLQSFERRTIALDLHIHDRNTASQRVTLEATIGGYPPFIARDSSQNLEVSLNHVRDEMIRQLSDAKSRTEPRNNRRLRDSGNGKH